MKRLHVHVSVDDLDQSTRFYSTLFAAEPTVVKDDYVKWMLDDPRVNFAISTRPGRAAGISHLGIQAEDETELAEVYRPPQPRRAADRRGQERDLLLRQIRQAMDRRSAGRALGDLLHLRRKHGVWRGLARQAEGGQRGGVCAPTCCEPEAIQTPQPAARHGLLRTIGEGPHGPARTKGIGTRALWRHRRSGERRELLRTGGVLLRPDRRSEQQVARDGLFGRRARRGAGRGQSRPRLRQSASDRRR